MEVYACLRKVGVKESPAPLCARSPLFVPSKSPVLISDVTHQYGVKDGVDAGVLWCKIGRYPNTWAREDLTVVAMKWWC